MTDEKHPRGWFLAYPHMQGKGGRIRDPSAPLNEELRGAGWFFCGPEILSVASWRESVRDYFAALKDGGSLIFWVPDVRHVEPAPGHQRVTLDDIQHALPVSARYRLVEADILDGHAYVVFRRNAQLQALSAPTGNFDEAVRAAGMPDVIKPWHKCEKHALVIRFGARGDALVCSSVLAGLKAEGFVITMLVKANGEECLRHDPNIDELVMLAENQMTGAEREEFFAAWSPRFDRVVNLNHTMEGELLKLPGTSSYFWSDDQRRRMCGGSYLKYLHQVAGVTSKPRVKYYPSPAEQAWAEQTAAKTGPFVLWQLKGSGPHKFWPYVARALIRLLEMTDRIFVLAGGPDVADAQPEIYEAVHETFGNTDRLRNMVDKHPLRDVLSLAQKADLVIGPETAVMHAVSFEPMPKIVFLSHSAPSNLTDDWVNTKALVPTSPCYPCHRIHHSTDFCPRDPATNEAACASSIKIPEMVAAAEEALLHGEFSQSMAEKIRRRA